MSFEILLSNAAALVVVVPLLGGAIAMLLGSSRLAWSWSLICALATFALSLVLLSGVLSGENISYEMGAWVSPLGILFEIDALNVLLITLVSAMGLLALLYGLPTIDQEIDRHKHAMFFGTFLICVAGLIGVSITGDAFNVFVFLEVSSISTYVLVAMGSKQNRQALTASFNYLILGTIGATFFVIGVGLLYMSTGTLNMVDISRVLAETGSDRVVRAAFAFIVIGLGLKIAMFPLHTWLPNAYSFSPSMIGVFLASTATKVALYMLIRFLYTVFSAGQSFETAMFDYVLAPMAVTAMIVCSVQASFQSDVRRLLAYSSVAQIGYMLLGLSMGTVAGLAAGLIHLFNHALMKGALFMAVGIAGLGLGVVRISDMRGLGKTMPLTAAGLTIAGMSLMGVPLTAGFISKYYLVIAALENGWWWAVVAIVVSSVLAIFYVGRMIEVMYLQEPPTTKDDVVVTVRSPILPLVALYVLVIANVWFFFDPSLPMGLANTAANELIGGGGS
ncbi:MAG: monovalent cation/H+ antiporter subunit D family protein [Robiginitomaculum sp.]|nr:monovalent cation/H+ antiporter subunit D family protein [Robiginitomaculum sp.]